MQNIYEANNNNNSNNNNNNGFNPSLKLARTSEGYFAPSVSRDLKPGNEDYRLTLSLAFYEPNQKVIFMFG